MPEEKIFGGADRKCVIKGGALAVAKLAYKDVDFERACRALLDEAADPLVIDLSSLPYIASPEMGVLMGTHIRAAERGKKVKVVISEKLAKYFSLLNMSEFMEIEVR